MPKYFEADFKKMQEKGGKAFLCCSIRVTQKNFSKQCWIHVLASPEEHKRLLCRKGNSLQCWRVGPWHEADDVVEVADVVCEMFVAVGVDVGCQFFCLHRVM